MNSLNKDCLFLIGKDLDFLDVYRWSITCKRIKELIYDNKYFWLKKIPKLKEIDPKNLAKYYYHFNLDKIEGLKKVCKDGDLELFKFLYFNYNDFIFWHIASSYGHLDIIKFLASQVEKDVLKFMIDGNCMRYVIQNSHVHLLEYFISQKATLTPSMLYKAAEYDSLKIVSLIQENIQTDFITRYIIRMEAFKIARSYNHEKIADYLEGNYHYYFIILFITICIFLFSRQ